MTYHCYVVGRKLLWENWKALKYTHKKMNSPNSLLYLYQATLRRPDFYNFYNLTPLSLGRLFWPFSDRFCTYSYISISKRNKSLPQKKLTVNRRKHISKDETLTLIATYQVLSKMQATQTKRPNLRFVVGLVLGVAAHILATNFDRRFLSPNLNPVNTW